MWIVKLLFPIFKHKISDIIDIHAPLQIATIPDKRVIRGPWITKGILILKSYARLDKLY